MFRNSLTLEELSSALGARVLNEKEVFLASGVVVPSPDLLVTMNRDHPIKRYEATRAYLLLEAGKVLVVHQIWEIGLSNLSSSTPRQVGVVPVMVVESDLFVLRERP
jgi:hypothetical protein